MIRLQKISRAAVVMCALGVFSGSAGRALACATCFGDPNSPMSKGTVWGVMVLVGVIGSVLATGTGVGIFWAVRSRRLAEVDRDASGLL